MTQHQQPVGQWRRYAIAVDIELAAQTPDVRGDLRGISPQRGFPPSAPLVNALPLNPNR